MLTLAFSYDIAIISIATRCDVTAAMTVGSRALELEPRSWFLACDIPDFLLSCSSFVLV